MAFNIQVNFGLLSIPGKYEKATETAVEMKNLCLGQSGHGVHDAKPLIAPKQCPECGPITDFTTIAKGIKQGSAYAIVTQEDVKEAVIQNAEQYKHKIDIVPHPADEFLTFNAPSGSLYYITPTPGAEGHYALLLKLVTDHGGEFVFAGLHTIRTAANLWMLVVRNGVLCMQQMTRGQALKPAPQVDDDVNQPLYDLLEATLPTMAVEFNPDTYEDKYALAVAQLAIDAQDSVAFGSGGKAKDAPAAPASDDDLIAKLKALQEQS